MATRTTTIDEEVVEPLLSNNPTTTSTTTATTETGIHLLSYNGESEITPVGHIGSGVEIGHGVYLKYPAVDIEGIIVYFTKYSNTSHMTGEEFREVEQTFLLDGTISYLHEVCLNQNGSMASMTFDQKSNKYIISNIGTIVFTQYDDLPRTFFWYHEGGCYNIVKDVTNMSAGGTANHLGGVQNISIS